MKQLLDFTPYFDPTTKTVDFSRYPGFSINRLYAIINITRNVPIYVPGAPGTGMASMPSATAIILEYDTTAHDTLDKLNVFYDVSPDSMQYNVAVEHGGNLQSMQETCSRMLKELMVMNYVMAIGLNIKKDDVDAIRNDLLRVGNNIATD